MRCCVPICKNDSRHISKSQGITFHVFPNEASLRTAWLQAIGKPDWLPKERSAICSEHFLASDLYETRSGLRKVRIGAVPFVEKDNEMAEFENEFSLKICRICLANDIKMYPLNRYKLNDIYEDLSGLCIQEDDRMPQNVCYECAKRMKNFEHLRSKCLRANMLLIDFLKANDILTTQNIKSLQRTDLESNLGPRNLGTDAYDLTLDASEDVKIESQSDPILELEYNIEVKNEEYVPDTDTFDHFSDESDYLPLEEVKAEDRKRKKTLKKREIKRVRKTVEPKIDRRRRPFLNDDLSDTLFTIKNLSIEEQIAEICKRQDSTNFKNSNFKCLSCYKGFLDEEAFNHHIVRHTSEFGEYECDICKTHFKHRHALRKHITAHHTQRFSCNSCPYVTTHRQTARLHERWHKGTKYQCPHCPDEFVKFTTYMGHLRIKHPSDYVCELCGYSFVSEKGIELHKKLKHRLDKQQVPPDGPYCEVCDVKFLSLEAHRKHLQVSLKHPDTNASSKQRNKGSRNEFRLKKKPRQRGANEVEMDLHRYPSQMRKAEGPIPCEQCGLQLEDSRAYHGHFRRMHPDKNRTNYPSMKSPCMCEVCGRIFQSHALLRDHTYVHTGEKPFKCDECPKSFRMKQRLTAHRRVHAKVKARYICNVCSKSFSTHSNRQRHMFIHTGLKPFKCEMCSKSFKHASEKRAHITYVHLKKPWPKRQRGKRPRPEYEREGQMENHQSVSREMDIWPQIEPKMNELQPILDDKPIYYNLKI